MNKKFLFQDLVDILSESGNIRKKEADEFLKAFFEMLEDGLLNDKNVKINNLGTFKLIEAEARNSVDVNTGESFLIKEHFKLSFVPDQYLKDAVNKPFSAFIPVETEDVAFSFEKKDYKGTGSENNKISELTPEATSKADILSDINKLEENISETSMIFEADSDTPEIIVENEKSEPETENVAYYISENCIISEVESDLPEIEDSLKKSSINSLTYNHQKAEDKTESKIDQLSDDIEQRIISNEKTKELKRKKKSVRRIRIIILTSVCILGIFIVLWSIISNIELRKDIEQKNKVKELFIKKQTEKKSPVLIDSTSQAKQDSIETKKDIAIARKKNEVANTGKLSVEQKNTIETSKQSNVVKNTLPKTVIIHPGERLLDIAKKYYGNSAFWVYIYLDNKDVISNPNNVVVGTKILISKPDLSKINPQNPVSIDNAKKIQSRIFSEFNSAN
jgi:nucleoid DNA-binding protein